jgi:hypothetical protein
MPAGNTDTTDPFNGSTPSWDSNFRNATEPLFDGDLEQILFAPGVNSAGEGVFAMFICAIVIIPLYVRTEDPTMPAIALAMFSGLAMPLLPGMLLGVAWGVLWIAGTVALFGLIQMFR